MANALSKALTAVAEAAAPSVRVPEVEQILDAALELFIQVGVKRTTIGDMARKAGIDRVTVYRRIGSKDHVVQAVATREATKLFERVALEARAGTTLEERIENGFSSMLREIQDHQMLNRMIAIEPEAVLMQLTRDGSLILVGATTATMHIFEEAVEDGILKSSDGMLPTAELLVRVVHSFMMTPHAILNLDTDAERKKFAREHLVPLVLATTPRT